MTHPHSQFNSQSPTQPGSPSGGSADATLSLPGDFVVIPGGRLDADQFMAEDIDGATENAFSSGNMSYASLQASQSMAEMIVANPFGGTGPSSDLWMNPLQADGAHAGAQGSAASTPLDATSRSDTDRNPDAQETASQSEQSTSGGPGSEARSGAAASTALFSDASAADTGLDGRGIGRSGTDGITGDDGTPVTAAPAINGTNGTNGAGGTGGQDGASGPSGAQGADGLDGTGGGPVTIHNDIDVDLGDTLIDLGDTIQHITHALTEITQELGDIVTNLGDLIDFGDVTTLLEEVTEIVEGGLTDITTLLGDVVHIDLNDLTLGLNTDPLGLLHVDFTAPLADLTRGDLNVSTTLAPVTDPVQALVDAVADATGLEALGATAATLHEATDSLQGVLDTLTDYVSDFDINDIGGSLAELPATLQTLGGQVALLGQLGGESLQNLAQAALDDAAGGAGDLLAAASDLTTLLTDGATAPLTDAAQDILGDATETIQDILTNPADISATATDALQDLPQTVADLSDAAGGVLDDLTNDATAPLTDLLGDVTTAVTGLADGLLSGLNGDGTDGDAAASLAAELPLIGETAIPLDLGLDPVEDLLGDLDLDFGLGLGGDISNAAGDTDLTLNTGIDLVDHGLAQTGLDLPLDAVEGVTGDLDIDLGAAANTFGDLAPDIVNADAGGTGTDSPLAMLGDALQDIADAPAALLTSDGDSDAQAGLSIGDLDIPLAVGLDPVEDLAGDLDLGLGLDIAGDDTPDSGSGGSGDTDLTIATGLDLADNGLAALTQDAPLDLVEAVTGDIDIDLDAAADIFGDAAAPLLNPDDGGSGDQNILGQAGDSLQDVAEQASGDVSILFGAVEDLSDTLDQTIDQAIDLLAAPLAPQDDGIPGGDVGLWTESLIQGDGSLFGNLADNLAPDSGALPEPAGAVAEGLGALDVDLGHHGGGLGGLFG